MKKTKIINLFGGPGSGKSTIASGIFSQLKMKDVSCDAPYEFPKVVAWEKNMSQISDQLYVLANQHRGIVRSYGKVDFIILDSPILLSLAYKEGYEKGYPSTFYNEQFDKMVVDLFKKYNNINFFLNRPKKNFQNDGRFQDYIQSLEFDEQIKNIMNINDVDYTDIDVDEQTINKIIKMIL